MEEVVRTAEEAGADHGERASVAVGGFGPGGVPETLIEALHRQGATGLEVISDHCGVEGTGLGRLLAAGRIRRVVGSYVGNNHEFTRRFLAGKLEFELIPQGTLAERLHAGGRGVTAFYAPAGVGTLMAGGNLPWSFAPDGTVDFASPVKECRGHEDRDHVLQHGITTDFALVRAARGDRHGNLVFHRAARNFNPLAAMAGQVTIAEVEQLVDHGDIDPDDIHLPGIFVQHVVQLTPRQTAEKTTEKRTLDD
ncbi:CoA transferase subunit A [Streptomyces sp. NPDC059385]|uniref:CoA transferase subunit A n=1 Tax=Streptomyces sp. NPDC059385 TaxID=3346817 RepID=UPI0036B1FAF0